MILTGVLLFPWPQALGDAFPAAQHLPATSPIMEDHNHRDTTDQLPPEKAGLDELSTTGRKSSLQQPPHLGPIGASNEKGVRKDVDKTEPAGSSGSQTAPLEQELLGKNEDYQLLSTTLTVLRNQLVQAQEDLQRLFSLRQEALEDPVVFVNKLRSKTYDRVPKPQRVVPLPHIDTYKYGNDPQSDTGYRTRTRTRSHMSELFDRSFSPSGHLGSSNPLNGQALAIPPCASPKPQPMAITTENADDGTLADERSHTFNQPWSQEEHERLMELMEIYPAEVVAARRMEKIASALGSRSPKQVATRVQKVMERMKSSRVPARSRVTTVTKRLTNSKPSGASSRVSGQYYSNRFSGSRYLGTTAVTMSDDEDSGSSVMLVDPVLRQSDEYKELVRLQAIAKLNACNQPAAHMANPIHYGFTCDRCAAEPIVGTRWTCTDCLADAQVDLCDECYPKGFQNETHNSHHNMRKVTTPDITEAALATAAAHADPFAYLGY
ncbi:hypothetical protein DFJ77DRAFT_83054 [Powellomyces hirtus]|nr:hypothetical protein DFJ77DRAFT_83054 [Powellomyces hirtus]